MTPRILSLALGCLFAVGGVDSRLWAQSAAGGTSSAAPSSFWGKQIAAQPMERQPFHEIRVPAWVEETLGCGYTFSVMSSEQRALAAKHGVTISEMGFVDPFYVYYDSKLLKRRSPHVPSDRLAKDIAEYRRLGVRILGVYPPCLQAEVYESHPQWRRIATDTTEIPEVDWKIAPHGGMLCLMGPYGDFMISVLEEILTTFPEVDAFSFDGLHYGGVCYCQHCRDSYRSEAGQEIPKTDMNSADFRRYQHWADRRMEELVRRMQTRLKAIKPEVALITWSTAAGRFGHFLSIPRNMPSRMNLLLDAPDQEFWMDESNRGSTIVPAVTNAYMWATTNHRVAFSEPYILSHGNPYGKDSFPPHEVLRRMLLAATYGTSPSIAVVQPERLQSDLYQCMDTLQAKKPWLVRKSPEKWAGILLSDNTRNFYGRDAGQVEQRYMANVFGACRACIESHLPFNIINDWNLNEQDLAPYAVIVLPNGACMDDSQIAALENYVAKGGGIVSSLDVSRFDAIGNARSGFGLENVLGAQYQGIIESQPTTAERTAIDVNFQMSLEADYWEKRKNVFDIRFFTDTPLQSQRMQIYVGLEPVTMKGPASRVVLKPDGSGKIWASQRIKGQADGLEFPAVVANSFGRGRSVYFAAGFDAAYYLYAYPYQRLAMADAIRWVASRPPPIVVDAPMCVHSTVMRQSEAGQERLVVHLFNDITTTAGHAYPNEDVPLSEETLPIHDIRIAFHPDYDIASVYQQPDGTALAMNKTERGIEVRLPPLQVHTLIVATLRAPR